MTYAAAVNFSRVFPRDASSPTFTQVFDRSICRINPHKTFPGPTSMKVWTPFAMSSCMHGHHLPEPLLGRLHERTMKGRAHGQKFGALGASFVCQFCGALDRSGVPGNHDLLGGIDVGWLANFALRRVVANGRDLPQVHAQDRGHGTHAHRDSFLHVFATVAHRADGVGKRDRSRGDMSGIFSQTVPSYVAGLRNTRFEHTQRRDGHGEDGWLSNLRQPKLVFRALETQLGKFVAEGLIGFFKSLPSDGVLFRQVFAHANGL